MKAFTSLLYKYAMESELVERNKATTLRTGHDETRKYPALSLEELEIIKRSDEQNAPYVVALCYLGCRINELAKQKS